MTKTTTDLNSFLITFFTILFLSLVTPASANETSERLVKAFKAVNDTLYEVEETRNYCNKYFSEFRQRNDEAYDGWELQYSFFLKDYDNNYFNWKNGFKDFQKQQLAVLDNIQRHQVKVRVAADYEEGGKDKCFTYKSALARPRSNPELKHQEEFNFIREISMKGFTNTRDVTDVSGQCAWQQSHSVGLKEKQAGGMSEKTQKAELKQYKKSGGAELDKNAKKYRYDVYNDMIKEIYDYPALQAKTYSLYRLSVCEMEKHDIDTESLKKINSALLNCQSTSAEDDSLLAACITKALIDK